MGSLSATYGEINKSRKAIPLLQEAIKIANDCSAQSSPNFKAMIARVFNNLACAQNQAGEENAALEAFRQALDICLSLADDYPAAYIQDLEAILRGYISVAPESPADPWWQLWKSFPEEAGPSVTTEQDE